MPGGGAGEATAVDLGPKCPTCGQAVHRGHRGPSRVSQAVGALWFLALVAALVIGLAGGDWRLAGIIAVVATGLMCVFAILTGGGKR